FPRGAWERSSVGTIDLSVLCEISGSARHFPTTLKTYYPNPHVWLILLAVYKYSSRKRQLS
ncbi:hypothetical protein, partial [Pseudomonas lactis]|uniref:hypothetical protein n=1 Tax=Pseudomonas lactis TaxID=1615674 RepID=UPI001CC2078B